MFFERLPLSLDIVREVAQQLGIPGALSDTKRYADAAIAVDRLLHQRLQAEQRAQPRRGAIKTPPNPKTSAGSIAPSAKPLHQAQEP